VGNLRIRRFLNPQNLRLAAFFELDRAFYDPCTADIVGDMAKSGQKCGLQSTNRILCASWPQMDFLDIVLPHDQNFYSCHYFIVNEVEKPATVDAQRWLKWRLFDLEERPIQKDPDYSGGGDAFRSVKLQIMNGIPLNR
jgi:hypothetical protein